MFSLDDSLQQELSLEILFLYGKVHLHKVDWESQASQSSPQSSNSFKQLKIAGFEALFALTQLTKGFELGLVNLWSR